jgi:hypothetical protein
MHSACMRDNAQKLLARVCIIGHTVCGQHMCRNLACSHGVQLCAGGTCAAATNWHSGQQQGAQQRVQSALSAKRAQCSHTLCAWSSVQAACRNAAQHGAYAAWCLCMHHMQHES